jgi:tripartite-type tricarboxylate transporter receptor subunit TctC
MIAGPRARIGVLAAVLLGIGANSAALAQAEYPSRPIRLIVGYAAGGLTDVMTRMLGERMSRELGQPVIVENKAGAATALASTFVAQSAPDGYTVLMGTTSLAINPTLQRTLTPRNPMAELEPVGLAYETPFVLLVSKTVPSQSFAEFIAYTKTKPGELNVASSGNGAVNHLILEMVNRRAGVKLMHIPYKGAAPAIVDILAGRIDATFATPLDAIPAAEQGEARILALTSSERLPLLPKTPPIAETLPNFRAVFWQALFVAKATPGPIIAKLGSALRAATDDSQLRSKVAERGVTMLSGGPEELRTLLKSETEAWGQLIREAGIQVE